MLSITAAEIDAPDACNVDATTGQVCLFQAYLESQRTEAPMPHTLTAENRYGLPPWLLKLVIEPIRCMNKILLIVNHRRVV